MNLLTQSQASPDFVYRYWKLLFKVKNRIWRRRFMFEGCVKKDEAGAELVLEVSGYPINMNL